MQVKVIDTRTGRVRMMAKHFADILVKLKKASYDVPEEILPAIGPVYNTAKLTANVPDAMKPAKEKKPKKEKKKKEPKAKVQAPEKKTYETKVMVAEE